ncbi:MAG: hypothetical protein HQL67_10770, partial [Magnetococcales bacterium]|nr:hypothetical protein [Magnetococcales bacterium]
MSLYTKNIEEILDTYDEYYDLHKSYCERLVVILKEIFNKTTIPVSSISGKIISRGMLRNKLLSKTGATYNTLDDIEDIISLKLVLNFHDDINLSISMVGREFLIEEFQLSKAEEKAQIHFGILMKRLSLMLPEEKYRQVEYERFASLRAELIIRTDLQNSWFDVKDIFDDIVKANHISGEEINKLAQVSYLLKMADDELCRIRSALISQTKDNEKRDRSEEKKAQRQRENLIQDDVPKQRQRKNLIQDDVPKQRQRENLIQDDVPKQRQRENLIQDDVPRQPQ